MKKISEIKAKTPKGTELFYYIEGGVLNVKTPKGVGVVTQVFAPCKQDRPVIRFLENGTEKRVSATHKDAQIIKALFNTVQKPNRELFVFSDFDELNGAEDFHSYGADFFVEDAEGVFAYKYNQNENRK